MTAGRAYAHGFFAQSRPDPPGNLLTPRQLEILALVADGFSTADIGHKLGITPGTIKTPLTTIYKLIGVRNRVQAARYYLDFLDPE